MARLRNLGAKLNRQLDRELEKAAAKTNQLGIEMVKQLTAATPVDTSQALSNWVVGIGAVDPSFIGPWVPGEGGSTRSDSRDAAIIIAHLQLYPRKFGVRYFVSNSADYIRALNDGTSKQAGPRFVETAIMRARLKVFHGR